MLVVGYNCVLRDDEVGRKAQFDFVSFVTVIESNVGLGTRKLMCTPNASKIDVDNGTKKKFGAFFISTPFCATMRSGEAFYSLNK